MTVELRLLGGASLLTADGQLVSGSAAQPRRSAVLAVLAEAWPAAVSRDRLVGLIWPEQDDAGARRLLTQSLYELRRELGDVTRSASRDIAIDADALRVDLIDFRRVLESGEYERAIAIHRGPFLDGFHLRGAPEFEQWATTVRARTQRELERALDALVARHEEAEQWRDAARWAEQLVHASPFDADAVARFMRLSERAGDPAAALRAAAAYEQRMRNELEVEPDLSIRRRAEEIRAATERSVMAASAAVPPAEDAVPAAAVTVDDTIAVPNAPPAPVAHGDRPRRRPLGRALVAAGLIGIVALAGLALQKGRSRSPVRVVTLLPFQVHSDGAQPDLVPAITSMLVTSLGGSAGVAIDTSSVRDRRSGAAWGTLGGVVVVNGSQLRIDAELRMTGSENDVRRASVTGPRDSLIALTERLSLELLPGFYEGIGSAMGPDEVHRFRRVEVLRHYLDGARALQRGAFEEAYDAFRRVTEQDSSLAYAWYRRAVAAEDAHRIADADRSAALAEAGASSLQPRERQLVLAYAAWRRGETWRADSLYRRIAETQSNDAEAWFYFAEVAYHGGPLLGRPLDAARDAWRQAVSLDSGSFPALMHAVRLEARARNGAGVEQLLRRATALGAREPFVSEARVIGAFVLGDAGRGSASDRTLDDMPDASVHFVHSIVAAFLEQPSLAEDVARRLTRPDRPDAVRADGYVALAHLALARGAWRIAMAELDSAARFNPAAASWWGAYFATLPFVSPGDAAVGAASRQLADATVRNAATPLYLELAVDARAAPVIERYNAALLRLAASPPGHDGATLACPDAPASNVDDLCADLRHGVAADALRRSGRPADALRELENLNMRVPYQLAGRSVYFARTRERFLRAELLERAGRLDEAYDWYAAVPHAARLDYLYLAPSHMGRARIRARQGNAAAAARHYRKVLALMPAPDPELAAIRRDAEAGLARLGNP